MKLREQIVNESASLITNATLRDLHQAGVRDWDDLPVGMAMTLPDGRNARMYYSGYYVFLMRDPDADEDDACIVVLAAPDERAFKRPKMVYGDLRSSKKLFDAVTDALDDGASLKAVARKYHFA